MGSGGAPLSVVTTFVGVDGVGEALSTEGVQTGQGLGHAGLIEGLETDDTAEQVLTQVGGHKAGRHLWLRSREFSMTIQPGKKEGVLTCITYYYNTCKKNHIPTIF